MRLAVLAACIVVFAASSAVATQLLYDPFLTGNNPAAGQYMPFTPPVSAENPFVGIIGQNPSVGAGFFSGGWQAPAANDGPNGYVQTASLSFLGTPSAGGALKAGLTDAATRQRRNLASPWTSSKVGTFYIGYEVNFGTGNYADGVQGDDMGYRSTEFYSDAGTFLMGIAYNTYGSRIGPAQQNPATGRMFADFSGAGLGRGDIIIENSPDSFIEDGATHLVVLEFILSDQPLSDSILVFLDPKSSIEPVVPGASVSGVDATLGAIGGFSFFAGAGNDGPVFDELRIADTFVDALPEFPLPGDTNNDDLVNFVDYQNVVAHMNLSGAAVPSTLKLHPDVTGDGKVTIVDYRYWKDHRTDLTGRVPSSSRRERSGAVELAARCRGPAVLAATLRFVRRRNRLPRWDGSSSFPELSISKHGACSASAARFLPQ